MLVLSRRVAESLLIGNDIEIEVLEIGASQVKLGIRAPREIPVLRRELLMTIRQNEIAAQTVPAELIDQVRGVR